VSIAGDAGVGKSRLAEEAAAEAESLGFRALIGRCYEMDGSVPYAPLVDLLARAARSEDAGSLRRALGDEAGEIAKILPELRRLFGDVPPSIDLPPDQERRFLFGSIVTVLERTATDLPLMIVLEDVHFADDATLQLLGHFVEHIDRIRAVVVVTHRHEGRDQALARLFRSVRGGPFLDIALKKLTSDEVSAMLGALGGREPPAAVVAVINAETDGNPFFIEEVVKQLKDEGRLFDEGGGWRADIQMGELEVPGSVRLVIGRQLDRISDETRAMLSCAAVAGRSLSIDLLRAIRAEEGDPTGAVAESLRAGIVTVGLDGTVTFRHELVRQALESSVSPAQHKILHARVAEALEQVYADRIEEFAAELALHLLSAGADADPEKTATYLTLAGERALRAAAYSDAVVHLDKALAFVPADDAQRRARLLERLGLALRALGRWEEALKSWDEALGLAERARDGDLAGQLCTNIIIQLGWAGRWLECIQFVARGLALLGQRSVHRPMLLAMQGVMLAGAGDFDTGAAMTETAASLAAALGDANLIGQCLAAKCGRLLLASDVKGSHEIGEQAIVQLRAAGALFDLCGALAPIFIAVNLSGRLDRGHELDQEFGPLVEQLGHHGGRFALHAQRGYRALAELDLATYEAESRRGDELVRKENLVTSLFVGPAQFGFLEFWRGRPAEAARLFRKCIELEPPGALSGSGAGPLILALAYAGDREGALGELAARRSLFPVRGRSHGLGSSTLMLFAAEALAVMGEDAEAAGFYPLVVDAIESGYLLRQWDLRSLQTLAGIAARCAGRFDDAERHFLAAIRESERIPVRLEVADAGRFFAEMLLARNAAGDRTHARELAEGAFVVYEKAGMPLHAGIARSQVERAG
jgi:tetratricopeptide (TPR) repeat protein